MNWYLYLEYVLGICVGICTWNMKLFQVHHEYSANGKDYLAMALAQRQGCKCTNRTSQEGRKISSTFVVRAANRSQLFAEMEVDDEGEVQTVSDSQEDSEAPQVVDDQVIQQDPSEDEQPTEEDLIRTGK